MVVGILVAAGRGHRFGGQKQFWDLAGKPVWERAAQALLDGGVAHVWVVVPNNQVDTMTEQLAANGATQRIHVVSGGASRFASVRLGLAAILEARFEGPVWIAVHDAARPFVAPSDVEAVVATAQMHGAAILATPCVDTLKKVAGSGDITSTIPRDGLWLAQTPQVFRSDWMAAAYWQLEETTAITDDASVMELMGYKVQVVLAKHENRKLTTPEDWQFALAYSEQQWGVRGI